MAMCFIANILILSDGKQYDEKENFNPITKLTLQIFNIILIVVSATYILLLSTFKFPLMKINSLNRIGKIRMKELIADYSYISGNFWFHLVFAVVSLTYTTIAYTYHLLLVVTLFENTMFIMK